MNGKRLQRWMKDLLKARGMDPDRWLYCKNLPEELHVMHRVTGRKRVLKMERRVG